MTECRVVSAIDSLVHATPQENRDVYLCSECKTHGSFKTIYSRNAKQFRRLLLPDLVLSTTDYPCVNRFTDISKVHGR